MEAAGAAKAVGAARNMMYDAVHMKPAGYAALAGKIRDQILQWMLAKKRKGGSIEQPSGKRARMDPRVGGGGVTSGGAQTKKGGSRPARGGQKGGRADKARPGKKQ
jgi:hypothetical protein